MFVWDGRRLLTAALGAPAAVVTVMAWPVAFRLATGLVEVSAASAPGSPPLVLLAVAAAIHRSFAFVIEGAVRGAVKFVPLPPKASSRNPASPSPWSHGTTSSKR